MKLVPCTKKDRHLGAKVIEIGKGLVNEDGQIVSIGLKVGDKVTSGKINYYVKE